MFYYLQCHILKLETAVGKLVSHHQVWKTFVKNWR